MESDTQLGCLFLLTIGVSSHLLLAPITWLTLLAVAGIAISNLPLVARLVVIPGGGGLLTWVYQTPPVLSFRAGVYQTSSIPAIGVVPTLPHVVPSIGETALLNMNLLLISTGSTA